jgi:Kef-type K+ transport system membrane component KefB
MGLRANFVTNFDLFLVLAVIVVAAVGKILGASFGAWVGGKKSNEALAIAFGLMPQGAMGIILAFLALEFSLINETVFVALVITAIMTSIASGPLIKWALRRKTTEVRIAPLTKT